MYKRQVFIAYDFLGITDGIDVLARLNDGTYYEDIFVSKLAQVMQDYGFNGWHGPDALGPSGALVRSDCSDSIMAQFAEYLGNKLPAEWVVTTGHDILKLQKRMDYIWNHLWHEWVDFNMLRWESFWRKIVNALRPLGKKTMINSSGTRAAFESINSTGMDLSLIHI